MKIFRNDGLFLIAVTSAFMFMTSANTASGADPISSGDKLMFELTDRYHLPDSADDLAWNRTGNKLVVGSWPESRGWGTKGHDSHVAVFELRGERLNKTHEFILNPAAKGDDVVAFSPDDRYIAVGNTTVELIDLQEGRSVWVAVHGVNTANRNILPERHFSIAFSDDGRQINTVGEGQLVDDQKNTALFWGNFDTTTGSYSVAYKTTVLSLPHAVATTRGRWSVTPEMTIKSIIPRRYWVSVRELGTGKEISRLEPTFPSDAYGAASALALSADGRFLAYAGPREVKGQSSTYLQVWDIAGNRLRHEHLRNVVEDNDDPVPTGAAIRSLDISADGKWLLMRQANAGKGPDLHVLNMDTGQRVWSSLGSVGLRGCRFSPTKNVFACIGPKAVLVFKKNCLARSRDSTP